MTGSTSRVVRLATIVIVLLTSSVLCNSSVIQFPDNKPPVADAGRDQTVQVGTAVRFDGSASYDPDWDFGFQSIRIDVAGNYSERRRPEIAIDVFGIIHVIWEENLNGSWSIHYARSDDGGLTFEKGPDIVNVSPDFWQMEPSISVDSLGDVHVAWSHKGLGSGIWRVEYSKLVKGELDFGDNVTFCPPAEGPPYKFHPSIFVDRNDIVHITWEDGRNVKADDNWDVYYARSDDGGNTFTGCTRVNDGNNTEYQTNPDIAVADDGAISVVWEDAREGNWDIYYSKSTDGGTTFGPNSRLNDDNATPIQLKPDVEVDRLGNPHIVWHDRRNGVSDLYYVVSKDGGHTFDVNKRINHLKPVLNAYYVATPSLVLDASGTSHVVWHNNVGGTAGIYYSRLKTGWDDFQFETEVKNGSSNRGFPSIGIDGKGFIHLVWEDRENGFWEVFHARGRLENLSYVWDFGDGSPRESGRTVDHFYSASGTYVATLTVTDEMNASDTDTCVITVLPGLRSLDLDIDPDTLNLRSRGKWITAYVTSEGAGVDSIEASSLLLNDVVIPDWWEIQNDTTLMVKFSRSSVQAIVPVSDSAEMRIVGQWKDGESFEIQDIIRVINPGG